MSRSTSNWRLKFSTVQKLHKDSSVMSDTQIHVPDRRNITFIVEGRWQRLQARFIEGHVAAISGVSARIWSDAKRKGEKVALSRGRFEPTATAFPCLTEGNVVDGSNPKNKKLWEVQP